MRNSKLIPKSSLYKKLRSFGDGGDVIYQGKLPFDEIVVYPSQEQQRDAAARRAEQATEGYRNWSTAVDMSNDDKLWANDKDNPSDFMGWIGHIFGSKPMDCINSASYWITNSRSIAKNSSLFNNPEQYGFSRIFTPQRGDLIQYIDQFGNPVHAGVVTSKTSEGTSVISSNGSGKMNPERNYNPDGSPTSGASSDMSIANAQYYRYTYPKSGVYFKINGEETKGY